MAAMSLTEGIALLGRRGKIVKALLIAGLVTTVLAMVGQIAELRGAVSLDAEPLTTGAAFYAIVSLIDVLLLFITFVLFGMWIYRAAANVVAAQVAGFDYTAGWAVGWLFVPFANLVKPFTAMRQIWNASHGASGDRLDDGDSLLTIWWTTWLVSNISGNVSFRIAFGATDPDWLRFGMQIGVFSSVVGVALYIAAIKLVGTITEAQAQRLTAAQIFA